MVAVHLALVELHDFIGHFVQEVPVVGHHQQGEGGGGQPVFKPLDGAQVQMVGGFVKQQHVGLFDEDAGQGHALALPARELAHVARQQLAEDAQAAENLLHLRLVVPGVEGVHALEHALEVVGFVVGVVDDVLVLLNGLERVVLAGEDGFFHRQAFIEHRLLAQVRHADALAGAHQAGIRGFEPG